MLLRVVAGVLNDRRRMAEEVAQDVFVEAFRTLPDFDPGRSRALNALRKKQPTYMPEVGRLKGDLMGEGMALLDAALHDLPKGQKHALLMAHVEGLTYRQIGGEPGANIFQSNSRAIPRLEILRFIVLPICAAAGVGKVLLVVQIVF